MQSLSRVRLFATPWAVARQAAPSMGFSRQEHWSRLPFPSAEHLPKPGMEPGSPALPAGCSPSESPRKLPLAKLARNHDPSTGSATNPRGKMSVSLSLLRRRYSFFRRSEVACFPMAARYVRTRWRLWLPGDRPATFSNQRAPLWAQSEKPEER